MWPNPAPALTRRERLVARFAEDEPLQFATSSGAEIAARAGTSEASVARAAQRLGFENVKEMKAFCAGRVQETADLQGLLRDRLHALDTTDAGEADTGVPAGQMARSLRAAAELVLRVGDSIDWSAAEDAARDIGDAARVVVYGLGTARSVADYAELEFSRLGLDARATSGSGHTNAHAVFQLTADDVLLVLAPRVIFPDVERFVVAARDRVRSVHLVTQAPLPDSLADVACLRLPFSTGSAATDSVPTLALIDTLVAEVARRHPARSLRAREAAQTYRDLFSR